MTRFGTTMIKVGRVARLMLMASALCAAAASNGHAACTAATTHTLSPAACGVVISTSGCYNMTTNLVATSNSGDCILITAANVYLNLTGVSITGTGSASTGNGIHVTGAGATIVNGDVSGFNIGILADAWVRLEAPDVQDNNSDGIQLSSAASSKIVGGTSNFNGGNGVTINGSNAYSLIGFGAYSNAGNGIAVSTSNSGEIANATASSNQLSGVTLNTSDYTNIPGLTALQNGADGIEVIKSTGTKIFATAVNLNGIYGVYLKESASNVIASPGSGVVHCNGEANVYLGCSDTTGPNGVACATPSSSNEIDNVTVYGTAGTPYGIAIDLGNTANKVLASTGYTDTVDDAYDANKAGQNTWFGNTFTTTNQSYIH
jgi:hypothetical protein